MSSKVINIKRIEETTLWKKLQSLNDKNSKSLIEIIPTICEDAADRMKAMPTASPQYTLHDESHFLRVVEIMAMVLGETVDELNSIELCLLILTAYYHDQGMVMTEVEYRKLSSDPKFLLFRENWYVDYPNQKEIQEQLQNTEITNDENTRLAGLLSELEAAMLTDYLRETHAKRSYDYVIDTFSIDNRLEIYGINLSSILAKLCESHYSHTHTLTPANGYLYDQQIGLTKINEPFIAIVLRLADILDFDADRTPDVLFRTIHFSSGISLREWEKHRVITGWEINENMVRYTAEYAHPAYQAAAFKFMDWVDKELSECQNLCRSFPAEFQRYKLPLPSSTDRSRIKPKNNSYICHDLEISLSRNEIIKLLMTDKLYNRPYICIRELLQNSLDALRYRKALFASADTDWNKGRVDFLHTLDDNGYEIVQCKDNGAGMDENIVTRFFTKAGRSFYRSPDYERERVAFRKKGIDFDPCSQFGIGFMSCFMLGDRIRIETRRDYGQGKSWGKPLVIEINGLGGLIIIRNGLDSQEIGTTVTITSRKKPSFLDRWADNVKLATVLKHFAVGTEFPIWGKCEIEELKEVIEIPTTPSYLPTLMKKAGVPKDSYITIEQDFYEIDKCLSGCIHESFLIDDAGLPTLENKYATWQILPKHNQEFLSLVYQGKSFELNHREQSQISIDGILLCGTAGRPQWQDDLEVKMNLGWRPTHIECNPYSLDVRGNLKPEITPAREPIDQAGGLTRPPKWKSLSNIVYLSAGRIWLKLINEYFPKGLSSETFWKLLVVHNGAAHYIPLKSLWQNVSIPLYSRENISWKRMPEIAALTISDDHENWKFKTIENQHIEFPPSIIEWEKRGVQNPNLQSQLNTFVLSCCCLSLLNDQIVLNICRPDDELITAVSKAITGEMMYIQTLRYEGIVNNLITVQSPVKTANNAHPLVKECLKTPSNNPLSEFSNTFVRCITDLVCSNEQDRTLDKPDRWMKISAHKYFAVDWSKYQDSELKPPYKIWLKGKGIIEITDKHFKDWLYA
ncbi:HD domain-containing protein [Methylomonas sp. MED-D]|uniref:HD domain-containing protein n=1 Tax=unclassified Methylomonas TaxID=2608980 RepID=UPI0028A4BD74|nr:hypothetical protein [Methylomonas sp. MV1]MDT4328452.1 hypothetical protein [Methylomonas sp. MV1]